MRNAIRRFAVFSSATFIGLFVGGCAAEVETSAVSGAEDTSTELDSTGQALGPITAGIVRANRAMDASMHLLARLEVQRNEILEFYEPSPGFILASGAGAPDAPLRFGTESTRRLSGADLWAQASGGAKMPVALEQAMQRVQARVAARPNAPARATKNRPRAAAPKLEPQTTSRPGGPPGNAIGSSQSALAAGWCDSNYFSEGHARDCSGRDIAVCRDNWWDGIWGESDDAFWFYSNVCPAQGTVHYVVSSDEGFGGGWLVYQNGFRWFEWHDANCAKWWDDCPWVYISVGEAIGDRFHFRFLGTEY
jgi:hypothetical protein